VERYVVKMTARLSIFYGTETCTAILERSMESGRRRRLAAAQPAKTTLFAGGKAPRLRRNVLRPINKARSDIGRTCLFGLLYSGQLHAAERKVAHEFAAAAQGALNFQLGAMALQDVLDDS
jgi:hypothetical protein